MTIAVIIQWSYFQNPRTKVSYKKLYRNSTKITIQIDKTGTKVIQIDIAEINTIQIDKAEMNTIPIDKAEINTIQIDKTRKMQPHSVNRNSRVRTDTLIKVKRPCFMQTYRITTRENSSWYDLGYENCNRYQKT